LNISASLLNKMVFQAKVAWFGPSNLSTFLGCKHLFLKGHQKRVADEGLGINSLSLRRERIVSVAVPIPDLTVTAMDDDIAAFIAGNLLSSLPGFLLSFHCPGGIAGIAFSSYSPAVFLLDHMLMVGHGANCR
jgi:hypothetical protein